MNHSGSDAGSATDPALTVGIDIGGTSVRAAVVDADGRVLSTVRAFTPDTVPATEDLLVSVIGELASGSSGRRRRDWPSPASSRSTGGG